MIRPSGFGPVPSFREMEVHNGLWLVQVSGKRAEAVRITYLGGTKVRITSTDAVTLDIDLTLTNALAFDPSSRWSALDWVTAEPITLTYKDED